MKLTVKLNKFNIIMLMMCRSDKSDGIIFAIDFVWQCYICLFHCYPPHNPFCIVAYFSHQCAWSTCSSVLHMLQLSTHGLAAIICVVIVVCMIWNLCRGVLGWEWCSHTFFRFCFEM